MTPLRRLDRREYGEVFADSPFNPDACWLLQINLQNRIVFERLPDDQAAETGFQFRVFLSVDDDDYDYVEDEATIAWLYQQTGP